MFDWFIELFKPIDLPDYHYHASYGHKRDKDCAKLGCWPWSAGDVKKYKG